MIKSEKSCFTPVSLSGYVQTLGHDKGKLYSRLMDAWARISPPFDHVTLVSMRKLNVNQIENGACTDFVEFYEGGTTLEHRIWSVCGTVPPAPKMSDARELHLHFKSDGFYERTGFQLVFSHHPVSRIFVFCIHNSFSFFYMLWVLYSSYDIVWRGGVSS